MGLLGKINRQFGYSEESMINKFDEWCQAMNASQKMNIQYSYPIAASLKKRVDLFRSKVYASGYATILSTQVIAVYAAMPIKTAVGLYELSSAKKLEIKDSLGGQKVLNAKLLNLVTMDFDDVILQIAPKVDGFPHQQENVNGFFDYLSNLK